MSYTVQITSAPTKFLERLRDEGLKRRIVTALRGLETDPHPPVSIKLKGSESLYRLRVGDYRVVYEVRESVLIVLVVRIGHRREIYR